MRKLIAFHLLPLVSGLIMKSHFSWPVTLPNCKISDNIMDVLTSNNKHISMTSLLTHTVAHSTRPSLKPKTNNQPFKKFLSLVFS